MKRIILAISVLLYSVATIAQTSNQGFNYQAVIRDGNGQIMSEQTISLKLTLQDESGLNLYYSEEHTATTTPSGIVNVVIGTSSNFSGSFDLIPWSVKSIYLKLEFDPSGGNSYQVMGVSKLQAVPYAFHARTASEAVSTGTSGDDEPIFVVRNKQQQIVFAVYESGVRMYVDDMTKSARGGFAVGGLSYENKVDLQTEEYLQVTPDNVRINVRTPSEGGKSARGGFAVGGLSYENKGESFDFFKIDPFASETVNSEARILWYPLKNAFLAGMVQIDSPDNVGENSLAIGFKNMAKGNYSQALGYESQALGNYSSAFGKNAIASEDNAFAFGDGAKAKKIDSYAFGSGAVADGQGSFAIGSYGRDTASFLPTTNPTIAQGDYSFSIGLGAKSIGTSSTAIGIMSTSEGNASLALGVSAKAIGDKSLALNIGEAYGAYSVAIGRLSKATGDYSVAIGRGTPKFSVYNHALGNYSMALGNSRANGFYSMAIGSATVNGNYGYGLGHAVTVDGDYAIGIGVSINAYSYRSIVFGSDNILSGNPTTYSPTNPLFVIGNGPGNNPSNALTILWNGNTGIGTHTPNKLLHVAGDARIEGVIYYGTGTKTNLKPDFVFSPEYQKDFTPLDVDQFIKENGHLPWVTKADNEEDGINLTRMQFETLESVENLQLQIIKQQKQLDEKQKEIDAIKAELEAIKAIIGK